MVQRDPKAPKFAPAGPALVRGSEILKGLTCPDARWLRCSSSKTLGFPPRRALPSDANPAPSTFNLSEPRTSSPSRP